MTVKDFRELRVYQAAFEAARTLFALTRGWPSEERFVLTRQILRSSRSVCGNIAEAWRKRGYPLAFASKMSDADGEAGETLVWLEFARDCGYLPTKRSEELTSAYEIICAQLVTMIKDAQRWCGKE